MEIFFNHLLGQIADNDWQVSYIFSKVKKEETLLAITKGWVIDEYRSNNYWVQQRQARLNIDEYLLKTKIISNSKISYKIIDIPKSLSKYEDIQKKYMKKKKFKMNYPLNLDTKYYTKDKKIQEVYYNDKLIALSIFRIKPYFLALVFFWDYNDPKLQIGYRSLYNQILLAKKYGYTYFYLGTIYDKSSLWKTKLNGFMWWNGTEWKKETTEISNILYQETNIKYVKDISNINIESYSCNS